MGLDGKHFTEMFDKEGGLLIPKTVLLQELTNGDVILQSGSNNPNYIVELQYTLNESVAIHNPRLPGTITIKYNKES